MTPEQAKQPRDQIPGRASPSRAWTPTSTPARRSPTTQADQRNQCFADIDKKMMEEVVPWVPYLWAKNLTVTGKTVLKFEFDQFSGYLSFTQMAVNNKADRPPDLAREDGGAASAAAPPHPHRANGWVNHVALHRPSVAVGRGRAAGRDQHHLRRLLRDALHRPCHHLRRQEPDRRSRSRRSATSSASTSPSRSSTRSSSRTCSWVTSTAGRASASPTRPARRSRTSSSAGSWSPPSSPSGPP